MTVPKGGPLSRRRIIGTAAGGGVAVITGFPAILRAQSRDPIKIGMPTILSGRFTQLGTTSRDAALLSIEAFNAAGGLSGRRLELVARDSKGRPDEAARVVRELLNNDGCQIIIDAEASTGAFAVHEVVRQTGHLCLHAVSETSALTADPKLRAPNTFRFARQGIHDSIWGGKYAADLSNAQNITRWMICSPDFAYGRDTAAQFMEYLKRFEPRVSLVDETWPKFGAPDYTENLTRILSAKADAVYSGLSGGDIVAFIDQANLYSLFDRTRLVTPNLADVSTLREIRRLPKNLYSGNRSTPNFPATPAYARWYESYQKRFGTVPSNWAWQAALATDFLIAAMRKTGSAEGQTLAEALRGLSIETPFGTDGTVTLRAEDQTVVNYAIGWGPITAQPPYFSNVGTADWGFILEHEAKWKRKMGYA
jgi:branched-chain amino acid transport system substrate-binding protein